LQNSDISFIFVQAFEKYAY